MVDCLTFREGLGLKLYRAGRLALPLLTKRKRIVSIDEVRPMTPKALFFSNYNIDATKGPTRPSEVRTAFEDVIQEVTI